MRLSDYIETKRIKKLDFAATVRVSPSYLSHLCGQNGWPGRDVAERIRAATNGAVTPNDFLPPMAQDPNVDPLTGETFE